MIEIELPLPPSVNQLYSNIKGRGRIKTVKYNNWFDDACAEYAQYRPKPDTIYGLYYLRIFVPLSMRGDLDNRIKAISDFLVTHQIINDDSNAYAILIARSEVTRGRAKIYVGPLDEDYYEGLA